MTGFRRGRSSIDNVIDLTTYIQQQKCLKRISVALFLDVKGAYDNVTHEAILESLEAVGIGGRMFQWIRDYLTRRSFYVQTENGPSANYYTYCGVPQGGVLSPILFNLAMIGLAELLPNTIHLSIYADDICLWSSAVTRLQVRARIQRAATLTCSYLRKQGLTMSIEKCALIAFTRKPMSPYPVSLNGQDITYQKSHRFLGVIIDRNLSWSPHCIYLKRRLISIIHIMKFLCGKTWGTSVRSMLQLYRTLFLGFLRYSLPVLANTCKTNIRTLQSLQGQALRTCLGLPRCASTHATIVIARDYLIPTYITVDNLRAHIRHLCRVPSHHIAVLPAQRPQATFSKLVATHQGCLPSGFTPAARPLSPPWCLRQPQVHLTIPGITNKLSHSTVALRQLTLSLLNDAYELRTQVYTDGSVSATSSTGAFIIPTLQVTRKFKVSHITTSTATELAALRAAVNYIVETPPRKWVIFCDSKAALQSLQSALRRKTHEQLVFETREVLHQALMNGHDIIFQWLPGHCGIVGNDLADDAARSAHKETLTVPIPLSRTDAARGLRLLAQTETETSWSSPIFTNCHLQRLDPTMRLQIPSNFPRRDATLLCRLWLGVAFTKAYSFLLGMSDTPICDSCNCEETVEHVLCFCHLYETERDLLRSVLDRLDSRPFSETKILGPWPHASQAYKATRALLQFMKSTGLSDRL